MPHTLFIVLLAALAFAALAAILRGPKRRSDSDSPWPLTIRPTILSPPELELYGRLVRALPEHVILA